MRVQIGTKTSDLLRKAFWLLKRIFTIAKLGSSKNTDISRCTSIQGDVPTSLLREPNTDKRDRSRERTARTLRTLRDAFDKKYEKELESIMQEKRVKEVFHDMGINSCSELPESLEQQQLINDELYAANMRMEEQIESLRSELEGLSLKKKSKKEVDPLTALCHKRKSQVQRFNTDLKQTKVELNEFNRILKVIYENQVSASASEQDSMEAFFNEEEETNFYMASLQTFLEQSMRPATHRLAESRATVQEAKQECKEGRLTELLSNMFHENLLLVAHRSLSILAVGAEVAVLDWGEDLAAVGLGAELVVGVHLLLGFFQEVLELLELLLGQHLPDDVGRHVALALVLGTADEVVAADDALPDVGPHAVLAEGVTALVLHVAGVGSVANVAQYLDSGSDGRQLALLVCLTDDFKNIRGP